MNYSFKDIKELENEGWIHHGWVDDYHDDFENDPIWKLYIIHKYKKEFNYLIIKNITPSSISYYTFHIFTKKKIS